jgi:hypothetical protein
MALVCRLIVVNRSIDADTSPHANTGYLCISRPTHHLRAYLATAAYHRLLRPMKWLPIQQPQLQTSPKPLLSTHALLPSQRLTMLSVWYHLKAHSAVHLARRRPPTLLPPSLPPPYPS